MPISIHELRLDQLSVEDRLELTHQLWDSISQEMNDSGISEGQKLELDRRLAEHDANPDSAIPWEEVEAQLRAQYAK